MSSDHHSKNPTPALQRGDHRSGGHASVASTGFDRARGTLGALRGSNLLLLTTLGAVDGTVFLMAASGALSTLAGAVTCGLTVVAGAGAWLVARDEFGRGERTRRDGLRLAATAGVASAVTLAAAWLGASLAGAVQLIVLPKAAGLVILLVAAEVAGLGLPRVKGLPLPVAALAVALVVETALVGLPAGGVV